MPIEKNYTYVVGAPGAEAAIAADFKSASAGAAASISASKPVSATVAEGGDDGRSVAAKLEQQRKDAVDKVNKAQKVTNGNPLLVWGVIAATVLLIFKKK